MPLRVTATCACSVFIMTQTPGRALRQGDDLAESTARAGRPHWCTNGSGRCRMAAHGSCAVRAVATMASAGPCASCSRLQCAAGTRQRYGASSTAQRRRAHESEPGDPPAHFRFVPGGGSAYAPLSHRPCSRSVQGSWHGLGLPGMPRPMRHDFRRPPCSRGPSRRQSRATHPDMPLWAVPPCAAEGGGARHTARLRHHTACVQLSACVPLCGATGDSARRHQRQPSLGQTVACVRITAGDGSDARTATGGVQGAG